MDALAHPAAPSLSGGGTAARSLRCARQRLGEAQIGSGAGPPRLPVRESETAFVWLCALASATAEQAHRAALSLARLDTGHGACDRPAGLAP
jgi:hypothetical protein